ncbi:hypothetical protein [Rhodoferax antarcticus]|uniref:Uncharacterized protein n=1 Tax=Rhodoferax antarcticus ANT.BR TaxID=1111071 RepID=A0A1Q8YAY7_9BURK|nr:hypothetical protein [Rhodoferax antarcticus]APW47218.1 hypothetical protein RA876_13625 [Rhodoferax antarcticus]OLP05152.1 hypothetical protein BLL52_3973 [Rhodoferax antarcticus ANT.BR]
MEIDKLERERRSLQAIHDRKHWHRWPLERPDGADAFLDSLNDLGNSPLTWGIDEHQFTGLEITKLIDELETAYYLAAKPWARLKTVYDSPNTTREELRWPDGTYPSKVQRDARFRFQELVTTSRFSVNEVPSTQALKQVNTPMHPVTILHVACLAAMVCIFDGIQALETILTGWHDISEPYRGSKPFQWLVDRDWPTLRLILTKALNAPGEVDFYQDQIKDAREASDQANAWLLLVENLQPVMNEINRANMRNDELKAKNEQARLAKKKQSNLASSKPRPKARKPVSDQQVGEFFNARKGQKHSAVLLEASIELDASESTIARRLKKYEKSTFTSGAAEVT